MRRITSLLAIGLCAAFCPGFPVRAADVSAEDVVRRATMDIYQALDAQCQAIARHPAHLYTLVDDILMPHADMERMAQWALGKYWRRTEERQRQEFIQQFRSLLVRTYATAVQLASLEDISYLPARESARPDRATVRTEINRPGSAAVSLHYSLYRSGGRWLVYDIQVDGVSLVNNYRTTFAEEISRQGFAHLLATLKQKNLEPMTPDTADEIRSRGAAICSGKGS